MKRITCCECGKLYHYEQDEFCPRCGAYNPPDGRRGFSDHAHLNGAKASVPSSEQLQKDDPVSTASKNFLYSREFQQAARPAARAVYYRSNPKRLIALVVVLVAILAALVVNLVRSDGDVSGEAEVVTHEFGSAFQVAGKQITLSNPRRLELPDEFWARQGEPDRPDIPMIVVDIRMTTVDADLNSLAPTDILLTNQDLSGGISEYNYLSEQFRDDLNEITGLDIIYLPDHYTPDYGDSVIPVSGQLLFDVQNIDDPDNMVLNITEYQTKFGSNRCVAAEHIIPLSLSDLPYAVLPAQA